jgi:hypothetical protein
MKRRFGPCLIPYAKKWISNLLPLAIAVAILEIMVIPWAVFAESTITIFPPSEIILTINGSTASGNGSGSISIGGDPLPQTWSLTATANQGGYMQKTGPISLGTIMYYGITSPDIPASSVLTYTNTLSSFSIYIGQSLLPSDVSGEYTITITFTAEIIL